MVRVLVMPQTVSASIARAPMGMTLAMIATMVVTKMANKCQVCAVKPVGTGIPSWTTRWISMRAIAWSV